MRRDREEHVSRLGGRIDERVSDAHEEMARLEHARDAGDEKHREPAARVVDCFGPSQVARAMLRVTGGPAIAFVRIRRRITPHAATVE
ncbi:MAG: hypothetical protein ABSH51_04490 [Solirubrobacteraceae bacterium]